MKPNIYNNKTQQDACEFLEELLSGLINIFPGLDSTLSIITTTTHDCKNGHKDSKYSPPELVLRIPLVDEKNTLIMNQDSNIQSLINKYYQTKNINEKNVISVKVN